MIDFPDARPREPSRFGIAYAVQEMRDRLAGEPPTAELYELAGMYDVTVEELGRAWMWAGLS